MNIQQIISTPWFLEKDHIIEKLETSRDGLDTAETESRKKMYGANAMTNKQGVNVASIIAHQFTSPLIFILIIAAVLTGVLQEWIDTAVILFAIFINAGLGFYQEYRAETTLSALTSYVKERTHVIRNGSEQEMDPKELVPGDIIPLRYGSRVPADARIIESTNLRIDEAILTGESLSVSKSNERLDESTVIAERSNMAHAGTLVVDGFGMGVITHTGNHTELGKIADLVSSTKRAKTPLQKGVAKLSWFIFSLLLLIVGGIFLLGISSGIPVLEMMMISIAVAVGSVPEALPITLTVILSVGAYAIAQKKGIVRNLASTETLGSTTLIMTDKTGTLTQADMKLVGIYTTKDIAHHTPDLQNIHDLTLNKEQKDILSHALYSITVTSSHDTQGNLVFEGRPFEKNIANTAQKHDLDISPLISKTNHFIIPFNSTNKFSVAKSHTDYIIMGAPDILIDRSNLAQTDREHMHTWIQTMSESGYRLLALGKQQATKNIETPEDTKDIQIMGILAFHDPIRPEVPKAVSDIEKRGVRVIMITGDLPGTAIAVAKELGWSIAPDQIITGADIKSSSDETLLDLLPTIRIFARVTPEDKLRIGMLYQKLGETVAMTGDGVNDSPALKAMNIGISLGSASDVAKSAADLVLLDDNFKTISSTITEGRKILTNIQKTFVYLLSNSLDEMLVITGSILFAIPIPLSALQIIWVNLATGSLPALAFAFDEDLDAKTISTTRRKPREIFTSETKFLITVIGVLTSVILFILYYVLLKVGIDVSVAKSIFFVCFALYILVIAFSFRSLHLPLFSYNPFSNKKLNYSILIGIGLTFMAVTVPFFQNIFEIELFPLRYSWIIVVWLIGNILLVEAAKWWFRHKLHKHQLASN
ncbi:MAG: HAD-IC family P-type ATPase [Candidatus Pacebacteria bacterium]|nr:HAD-IC family P-type ATPase [Candidatus Paceibacterota bacterium]